jgi:chemotaxis protein CheX
MDVRYINPFLSAIQNVFETMVNIPFTLGKPGLKKDDITSHEVSGIIGISGEVTGSVVVSFPESVALQIASALLGSELQKVDGDCTDTIGEIANMVAGDAKKGFPKADTSVSVPTVVIGKHKVAYPRGVPIITIPCKTSSGAFSIDVALKVQLKNGAS